MEGTGAGVVGIGGRADGTAGTWTEIDGAETLDGSTAAGPCGECCAGSAADWPALELAVDGEGDAEVPRDVLGIVEGAPDCVETWLSELGEPWAPDSWPKKGISRACPTEPAASRMPTAPVTTAIRLLIVRTAAAFFRTACGSRLKEEPARLAGATPVRVAGARPAVAGATTARVAAGGATVGMASVAGSVAAGVGAAGTVGMAAVAGSGATGGATGGATVGMVAVSPALEPSSWAARCRSAARAAARVVNGAVVVGVAAGVGAAVDLSGSETGAGTNGALSFARRRPVGLVLSRAIWARRG
ncbi:hypothetical protein [Arthrobacter alkaliphilus]|uniref:hypothetical protein n=1 Tax=Arthrobacter alkaliphilus TaxID=369936 RepID=UPI001F26836F|nr:hypothetical protein [Arthrobacter alkaliphilus]